MENQIELKAGEVRIRALKRVNVDGVHLEPQAEHVTTAKRAKSLGKLVETIEEPKAETK